MSLLVDSFSFFVPGDPQPKERPRARFNRGTNRVQVFTPSRTRKYEELVASYCRQAASLVDWAYSADERFAVKLIVHLKDGRRRDIDNIAKAVLDACNGEAWEDDWQVVRLDVSRCLRHPEPGVWARVTKTVEPSIDDSAAA